MWSMLPLFLLFLPNSGHPKESKFIPHFIIFGLWLACMVLNLVAANYYYSI
jgi:hypothetical protein